MDRTKPPLGSGCDGIVWRGKLWEHVDVAVKEFYMVSNPGNYGILPGSAEQTIVFDHIQEEARWDGAQCMGVGAAEGVSFK